MIIRSNIGLKSLAVAISFAMVLTQGGPLGFAEEQAEIQKTDNGITPVIGVGQIDKAIERRKEQEEHSGLPPYSDYAKEAESKITDRKTEIFDVKSGRAVHI